MFSMLYFPAIAALVALAADEAPSKWSHTLDAVLKGDLGAAVQHSGRRIDELGAAESRDLQWHADLQLVLGFDAEAEDTYRTALRRLRVAKCEIRVTTCRNAAWQALFGHRIGTALTCFARAADEAGAHPARRAEARIGIACALYELGRTRDALDALRASESLIDGRGNLHWRELFSALRADIVAQHELRCADALHDHVYWRSAALANPAAYAQSPLAALSDVLRLADGVRAPLFAARVRYLRRLHDAANGVRDAVDDLIAYLARVREQGYADYQRTVRLEIALATLVGNAPTLAQAILDPLHQGARAVPGGHRQLEYLYCSAKMREAQGRAQESMRLYSRYALAAMQCLREDSAVRVPSFDAPPPAAPDDVSARLPAKYRRAYRYMLDNLDRADLSVREVATQIGVTERALQGAFKGFLGLSPSELIRTRRMERIRDALLDHADAGDHGVLKTARRWGVQSRSTLVTGYRKQFREAPSETLER